VVYGRRCRPSEVDHELAVADVALHFRAHPFSRDAAAGAATADGVFTIDGRRCYLELDHSGHMDRRQMAAKWRRYPRDLDAFILVVAMTEARMERLRQWCEPVKDVALFTTLERLRAGRPWVDGYGNTVTI
jgi:hypothetical protein